MVERDQPDPLIREVDAAPLCEVCGRAFDARCIRCERPACLACDFCHGCEQIFCEACNTDPTMAPELFPGDRWPHPQNAS